MPTKGLSAATYLQPLRVSRAAIGALLFAAPLLAQAPSGGACSYHWQPGLPVTGANARVTSVCETPQGDLIAGGWFRTIGGAVGNRVGRWNGSEWLPLGDGLDESVFAVAALPNGDIVVGGLFTHAGGQPANHIARWDGTAWSQIGQGFDAPVSALLVEPNGDLIAGGAFTASGSTPVARVARLSGGQWTAIGSGIDNGHVYSLARLPNGELVAGGVMLGGARLFDGTSWQSLGLANNAQVLAMETTAGGELLLGGSLFYNGSLFSLGTWDGAVVNAIASPIDRQVTALRRTSSGALLVGGQSDFFSPSASVAIGGVGSWQVIDSRSQNVFALHERPDGTLIEAVSNRPNIAAYDGSTWQPIGAPQHAQPSAIAGGHGDEVYVGGSFASYGGVAANNVVMVRGDQFSPLGQGVDGAVTSVAVAADGSVVIAGAFQNAGGAPAQHVARWNGSSWTTLGGGLASPPRKLAAGRGAQVAAVFDVQPQVRVFDGVAWNNLPPIPSAFTTLLRDVALLDNGDIVVVGLMDAGAYRWDGSSWIPLGSLQSTSFTNCLDIGPDGALFVADSLNGVRRWDGSTWVIVAAPSPWSVTDLVVLPNGNLVVSGSMTDGPWTGFGSIGLWDGTAWWPIDGGLVAPFTGVGSVQGTVVNGIGELWVSGFFTQAGQVVSSHLARATTDCPASVVTAGAGCVGGAGPVTLSATDLPWIGATLHSRAVGMTPESLALHAVGTTAIAAPLPLGAPGCSLLVEPAFTGLLLPQNGTVEAPLAVPPAASLIGLMIRTQVIGLELDPSFALLQLTSSNALDLTIGSL